MRLKEFAENVHPTGGEPFLQDFLAGALALLVREYTTHFLQCQILDLAHSFAGDFEVLAHFLQRHGGGFVEAKAQTDDLGFAGL